MMNPNAWNTEKETMTNIPSEFIEVRTTYARREDAEAAMGCLIDARLAACAQVVGPIHSAYHWKGAVERAEEWLCLIKTASAKFTALEKAIKEAHPYTVPEILAVPVLAGNPDYLQWMRDELNRK
jgi:periplasmic divalent cation tolerance protein